MKIKLFFLKFYDLYTLVIDNERNPLRHIPDPSSRLTITTVLAWLWCVAFGLYMGNIMITGISFLAHLPILFMIFLTAAVFYDAELRKDSWLIELRKVAAQNK
jgi:hypothetical protein